jgi:hypothetical protein
VEDHQRVVCIVRRGQSALELSLLCFRLLGHVPRGSSEEVGGRRGCCEAGGEQSNTERAATRGHLGQFEWRLRELVACVDAA